MNPGATELCDATNTDEDCDGLSDDADSSATGQSTFYADADSDGYGGATTGAYCDLPSGYVATSTDCDDAVAAVNPGALDATGDGLDADCDGVELCLVDADGDGYVDGSGAVVDSLDADCADVGEALASALDGDCDDGDAMFNPGAIEDDCTDPADYNCDGSVGYADADADGFAACEECDDGVGATNPDADEVCDGADNDCDGTVDVDAIDAITWYADADGDGYTDPGATETACAPSEGYAAATEDDCDDADGSSFPGAEDVPDDGIDQDCDGADATGGGDSGDTADTGDTDDIDAPETKDDGGCGCTTSPGPGAAWALLFAAVALGARRRRAA